MLIKVEPADFFMYRAILIFDLENRDPEDQQVRDCRRSRPSSKERRRAAIA